MDQAPARRTMAFALGAAILILASCDGAGGGSSLPSPTLAQSVGPGRPTYAPPPTPAAPTGPTVVTDEAPLGTVDPVIDPLLRAIENRDEASILALASFASPRCPYESGCAQVPTSVPVRTCSGTPPATRVAWSGNPDEVAPVVRDAFSLGDGPSIYAVSRGTLSRSSDIYFQIWTAASDPVSPRGHAVIWVADQSGRLVRIEFRCQPVPVAEQIGGWVPDPAAMLVPPRANCQPGEATTFAEMDGWVLIQPQDTRFTASELSPALRPTDHRVTLVIRQPDVRSGYLYPIEGSRTPEAHVTEIEPGLELKPGTRLSVHGWRYWTCVVEAWTIREMN